MAPTTIGPDPSPSPSPMTTPTSNLSVVSLDRIGTSRMRGRSIDSVKGACSAISRTSSSTSIPFASDEEVEVITEAGLRHTERKLNAKRYKSREFARDVLEVLVALKVPTWSTCQDSLSTETMKVFKVSGSLTNAVFFISHSNNPNVKTVLLRIYGPSSSELISRPHELHTLHILSSKYRIGPRIYGTFENGRVEEYFDSTALSAAEMRNPTISRWIGARMAELHCVDVELIEGATRRTRGWNGSWEIAAQKNVREWIQPAREVLRHPSVGHEYRSALDFERLINEWEGYMSWLERWEKAHGASRRVFAHNDTQYGNLLRRADVKEGTPEHRQIIVVDFEYAAPNAAAFDIANHFHEWTADYHGTTPHILDPRRYPSDEERRNFYRAYLSHVSPSFISASCADNARVHGAGTASNDNTILDISTESKKLDAQVKVWSPASHAMWAVWGLVQAREDLELAAQAQAKGMQPDCPEFDYLGYARCRVERFRAEVQMLGL